MAIHFEHKHGELVEKQGLICPYCLTLQETLLPEPPRFTCSNCKRSFPTRDGIEMAEIGFNISYFGWFYGIIAPLEERLAKNKRRKPRRFRLGEPIEFLQLLALWTAAGIVGNLGYDLIKTGAMNLYKRYRARKVPRSELSGQTISPYEAIRQLAQLHEMTKQYLEAEHYEDPSLRRKPSKTQYRVLVKLERTYRITNKLTRRKRRARSSGERAR